MPPCRSPTVAISLKSTPIVTSVWAISGDRPVTITVAPRSRDASTVCTRWFATFESMAATPVMSITTTLARLVRIARSSCSVSWRALRVDHADDGKNEEALAYLEHRRRKLPDRLLLLPDDALALLHEAHRHRVRDPVRGGLVGVENAVQLGEVFVVLREQRPRQHVAEQEHDPDHFVRLDATRDDALRQVARVRLEGLERPGLERLDVVVVHRRRFREDLFFGHRGEQLGLGDTTGPLLAQLRTVLPQVGHELAQQPLGVLPRRLLGLQRDGGLGVLV